MVQTLIAATQSGNKFFYNIDAKVGARAPNRGVDVQLVQFGYFAMLRSPKNAITSSAAERDAFSKIVLGKLCTGAEDDPLLGPSAPTRQAAVERRMVWSANSDRATLAMSIRQAFRSMEARLLIPPTRRQRP